METTSAFNSILDGLDVETYLVCRDAQEGKRLVHQLGRELNLGDIDVMFEEFDGYGMRIRFRKYFVKPGQSYPWLR